ncbi:MAG: DMT family transporter [Candidatus Thorarchaeota archaeon]
MKESAIKYYAMLVSAMVLWGASWVSKKIAVSAAPPLTIGFLRFLSASVVFFIFMVAIKRPPHKAFSKSDLKLLLPIGIVGVFGYETMELLGLQLTTAAQGAIIDGFQPVTIAIFAFIILRETLTRKWQYIGFLFGFLGIISVVGTQFLAGLGEHVLGDLVLIGATCVWAIYSALGKRAMGSMDALDMTAGGIFIGTIFFGLTSLTEQWWTLPAMVDPIFWANILFLGMVMTFLCFLLYFESIRNIGATRSGVFVSLIPISGTILSFFVLGEEILASFWAGLVLVTIGIIITNFPVREGEQKKETTLPDL